VVGTGTGKPRAVTRAGAPRFSMSDRSKRILVAVFYRGGERETLRWSNKPERNVAKHVVRSNKLWVYRPASDRGAPRRVTICCNKKKEFLFFFEFAGKRMLFLVLGLGKGDAPGATRGGAGKKKNLQRRTKSMMRNGREGGVPVHVPRDHLRMPMRHLGIFLGGAVFPPGPRAVAPIDGAMGSCDGIPGFPPFVSLLSIFPIFPFFLSLPIP
jgi:hypothetical protein